MRTRGKATPLLQFAMLQSIADMDSESRLGAFLRLPLRLIPRNQILKVRGGVNKGARWLAGSSIHGCWLGTYERDKQDLVEKLVRPGMVVWDIGANAGFYSIAFSKLVGARGAVYAFEPLAENVKNILKHVALNEVENVTVMQGALGERSGIFNFQIESNNAEGKLTDSDGGYLVPAFTADDFLERFPRSKPELLKIDVEGAESAVLAGAESLLSTESPDILLALHGEDQQEKCREILAGHGYRFFSMNGEEIVSEKWEEHEVFAKI